MSTEQVFGVCTICVDTVELVFRCKDSICKGYQLCLPCIKMAFEDNSGENSANCPMCRAPIAIEMIEAVCGKGAVRAVENTVRATIQFRMEEELRKREDAKKGLSETNSKAAKLFNELAELCVMKCPRCKTSFYDYDGCNALRCRDHSCGAGFCAICLQDCGQDAHAHVRDKHGDLFNKKLFEDSRTQRQRTIVSNFLNGLSGETNELKQLLQNHIDRAALMDDSMNSGSRSKEKVKEFVSAAKASLNNAAQEDRLSILSDPDDTGCFRRGFTIDDISPRCLIPEDYELRLVPGAKDGIWVIDLKERVDLGRLDTVWHSIALDRLEDIMKGRPQVDALMNIKQALNCAVLAIEGMTKLFQSTRQPLRSHSKPGLDEVCIRLTPIDKGGNISSSSNYEPTLHVEGSSIRIIGVNQNARMMQLQYHVQSKSNAELIPAPLKQLIGAENIKPVFTEIHRPVPDTSSSLNEKQEQVANPLKLKTAMEVAGPPGTGKTKTIVELVRALLECSDHSILVLSERNGAINAIAEKFLETCLKVHNGKVVCVSNALVWTSVMTFGAGDAMGAATKLFTLDGKLSYHPDLVDLKGDIKKLQNACKTLSKKMRDKIADALLELKTAISQEELSDRIELIRSGCDGDLATPCLISNLLTNTVDDIEDILGREATVTENEITDLVVDRNTILGKLIPVRTQQEIELAKHTKWEKRRVTSCLRAILVSLRPLTKSSLFDLHRATRLANKVREKEEEYKKLHSKISEELPKNARLQMATIGSSHKIPGGGDADSSGLADRMNCLKIDGEDVDSFHQSNYTSKTIVIFDEAGCIPDFELLGLTRISSNIDGIILVGDEHQLPPYDAKQGKPSRSLRRSGSSHLQRITRSRSSGSWPDTSETKQKSLLDVSTLTTDKGKVMLTTQYRVPRDIAEVLNIRVYNGNYNTSPNCNVPNAGFKLIDVPSANTYRNSRSDSRSKMYVNPDEVRVALDLARNAEHESLMILTPYKKQQRELEFQLKKNRMEVLVLTIDQCQGQEADLVILSLVQKPTRFLTKNRLNVALSRVRQKLYLLVDKGELRTAANDASWEGAGIARDLLQM